MIGTEQLPALRIALRTDELVIARQAMTRRTHALSGSSSFSPACKGGTHATKSERSAAHNGTVMNSPILLPVLRIGLHTLPVFLLTLSHHSHSSAFLPTPCSTPHSSSPSSSSSDSSEL